MILDTLIEVYEKEVETEEEALDQMAEDAMRGRKIRRQEGDASE